MLYPVNGDIWFKWKNKFICLLSATCYKSELIKVTNVNYIVVTFVTKVFIMKERLLQLLDLEQLSPSKFADIIGVQRSSVSHVISGRNKPSYDFLQKTLSAFPGLNASWLIMGEGTMYEKMGRNLSGNLFDTAPEASETLSQENIPVQEDEIHQSAPSEEPFSEKAKAEIPQASDDREANAVAEDLGKTAIKGTKKIVQVMVSYEDDTCRAFTPAH